MAFAACLIGVCTKTFKGKSYLVLRIDVGRSGKEAANGIHRSGMPQKIDALGLVVPARVKRRLVVEAHEELNSNSTNLFTITFPEGGPF